MLRSVLLIPFMLLLLACSNPPTAPLPTPEPQAILPTKTATPTSAPTSTAAAVIPTPTLELTPTPTVAPTSTPTLAPAPVPTSTPYPTYTPFPTYTPYPTHTPQPTATPTETPRPTQTPVPSPTSTPTPLPTVAPAPIPTAKPPLSQWKNLRIGVFTLASTGVSSDRYYQATLWLECNIDEQPQLRFSLPVPLETEYVDRLTSFTTLKWNIDGGPSQESNRVDYSSHDYFSTVTFRRERIRSVTLAPAGPSAKAYSAMLSDLGSGAVLSLITQPLSGLGTIGVPSELTFFFPITGALESYRQLPCAS